MALRVFPQKIELNRIRKSIFLKSNTVWEKISDCTVLQKNLTLEACIELCRTEETSAAYIEWMHEPCMTMDNHRTEAPEQSTCAEVMAMRNVSGGNHRVRDYSRDPMGRSCRFRGHSQRRHGCPAFGITCLRCGRKNHFAACCQNFGGDSVKYVQLSTEQEQDVTGEGSSQCVNTVATNGVLRRVKDFLELTRILILWGAGHKGFPDTKWATNKKFCSKTFRRLRHFQFVNWTLDKNFRLY